MTERKFFKRTITLEFLSEEPIPCGMTIESMVEESINGSYSMRITKDTQDELNGKQAVKALKRQGSDPLFFRLTANGEDEE